MAAFDQLFKTVMYAAGLIFALVFVSWFLLGFRTVSSGGLCGASALVMAETKPLGAESPLITDLKCETNYLKIGTDGIRRYDDGDYKLDFLYKGYKGKEDYYIKKLVAEEMKHCWTYLGRGKIDPFGKYDDRAKCVICTEIGFEPNLKERTLGDFDDFLKMNSVKDEQSGQQVTYWDYLSNGAVGEMDISLQTEPTSIIFTSIKPDHSWDVGLAATGTGVLATGCTSFPYAVKKLGSLLGKVPSPSVKVAGLLVSFAGSTGKLGSKGFAFACKSEVLKQGRIVQKGALMFGTVYTGKTLLDDEEPRLLGIQLVPSSEVREGCNKLYG